MVLFFTTTLLISIVGLVSLLSVKRWEIKTGRILLAGIRPGFGEMSHVFLTWIERVLPSLIALHMRRSAHAARLGLRAALARGLLAAEHWLERVLLSLKGVTEHPKSNKEASPFLREVAEHKRKLLEEKLAAAEESRIL